eukprot:GHRQ01002466.1.p1 GENE.GHRQ01002466.1~~GHRQ01002466.1.p1  ORF type:complete len:337 (+),score=116.73 GHRQ01002466.1:221-1231(+)
MYLQGRPLAAGRRHQASPKLRTSQVPACGVLPCREQRLIRSCAFNRDNSGQQSQPDRDEESAQSGWAADNISSAQMNMGNVYSHDLPWKEYSHLMFLAIEAEADSKQEMQDAYDGCMKPTSDSSSIVSSRSLYEDDSSVGNRFHINIPTPSTLPALPGFSTHVQKSMEANDAAEQLRQAAEDEAQRFLGAIGAASGTEEVAFHRAALPDFHSAMFLELEASMQQGMQAAHDRLISSLRRARLLLHKTQRALADRAEELRLKMSQQLADLEARAQQALVMQQLQGLSDEAESDMRIRLTSQFLPKSTLSVDEAREWLDKLWVLDMPRALDSGSEEAY